MKYYIFVKAEELEENQDFKNCSHKFIDDEGNGYICYLEHESVAISIVNGNESYRREYQDFCEITKDFSYKDFLVIKKGWLAISPRHVFHNGTARDWSNYPCCYGYTKTIAELEPRDPLMLFHQQGDEYEGYDY